MKILLNAINAIGTGAAVVVRNILETIPLITKKDSFVAVLPAGYGYENISNSKNFLVKLVPIPKNRVISRIRDIYFAIPAYCVQYNIDICFTLGDIGPTKLQIPQVVLLHQPYITYHLPEIENKYPIYEKLKIKYIRWQFGRMTQNLSAIFVQTPVMAKRLKNRYNLPSRIIHTIPQAIPQHIIQYNYDEEELLDLRMLSAKKKYRLLFLAAGYEHKNHSILPALVRELRCRGLNKDVHIFVTLNPSASWYESKLIAMLSPYSDCVTNLGRLSMNDVSRAYMTASALFIPTFLETFGLIYLEAMVYGKPILTSDRDFARWMCGDNAIYFDPKESKSIANAIERLINDEYHKGSEKIIKQRLNEFPSSWRIVSKQYLEIIKKIGE